MPGEWDIVKVGSGYLLYSNGLILLVDESKQVIAEKGYYYRNVREFGNNFMLTCSLDDMYNGKQKIIMINDAMQILWERDYSFSYNIREFGRNYMLTYYPDYLDNPRKTKLVMINESMQILWERELYSSENYTDLELVMIDEDKFIVLTYNPNSSLISGWNPVNYAQIIDIKKPELLYNFDKTPLGLNDNDDITYYQINSITYKSGIIRIEYVGGYYKTTYDPFGQPMETKFEILARYVMEIAADDYRVISHRRI